MSEPLLERLLESRRRHHYPSQVRPLTQQFAEQVLGLLFPHHASQVVCSAASIREELILAEQALERIVRAVAPSHPAVSPGLPAAFIRELLPLLEVLEDDAHAILEGDPAAHSLDEVVLTYPGFYAIAVYRIAHALQLLELPLVPRLLTEFAHEKTGIDLHPGATIGRRFCIDHGTGVVVGETTHIGNNVKLYQGVTLGALTVVKDLGGRKRHPTLEDNVVIYAGATILGGNTVVGRDSIVAGNAFVTRSIPPDSLVGRTGEVRSRHAAYEMDFVI